MPSDSMISLIVDTNVLVYSHDPDDTAKQDRARTLLATLESAGLGALTAQVLGEFISISTRSLRRVVPEALAREQVAQFARAWPVYPTTLQTVLVAMRGRSRHGLAYYDAQIWACAKLNGVRIVLTEDFEDGRRIEGVVFRDPFSDQFDLDALLTG